MIIEPVEKSVGISGRTMMNIIDRKSAFASALLALLLLFGCSVQKDVYSKGISELPKDAKYESGPGYSRYIDPDIVVEASYLSPAGLEVYFSRYKSGNYENPYTPLSFMVFSLSLENKGDKKIMFNPRMTLFVTEKREPIAPKDFSSLYSDFSMAEADDVDKRMETFKVSAFDTSETLMPGETVQKLMVFPRTEETAGGGVFLFNGLYVGDKARNATIQYKEDLSLPEGMVPPE